MNEQYNGWTNYETWIVNLWMDESQSYYSEIAQEVYDESEKDEYRNKEQVATRVLADMLKEQHEEMLPEVNGFIADLLNSAMSEVNWYEIAEHYIDEVEEKEEIEESLEVYEN